MIERIVIENFKSLRKVDLSLGRMNLFIGTNGSGKSNFLDVFRVLQGIGSGLTVGEILNGKPRDRDGGAWEGIRGGSLNLSFALEESADKINIVVYGKPEEMEGSWQYGICFLPREELVTDEYVKVDGGALPTHIRDDIGSQTALSFYHDFEWHWSQMDSEAQDPVSEKTLLLNSMLRLFAGIQTISPDPTILRGYSQPGHARWMGAHGEDFASLVDTICRDKAAKDAYLAWLRQLRPGEVDDVGTLSGALGEAMFMLRESGREFPAPALSDGTLRFAAVAAAFFQPIMPGIMMIEEMENGIHASRVQLLLDLLHSQSEFRKTQVIATTHSATVLDWLQEDDYKTTFLCKRDEATGESKICSLADIPRFMDVVGKRPASELFSEGWLEMAS